MGSYISEEEIKQMVSRMNISVVLRIFLSFIIIILLLILFKILEQIKM